ncbi:hypothetical protein [Anaerostipes caccae]|uniref:hypothetical protein n=1 Tax=Anaerostipes caccae TaxID=105841 RepID=UPI0038D43B9B
MKHLNIDPAKIKQLVKIYSELNEENQIKLLSKAISLSAEQTQYERIKKEKIEFKNNEALKSEVQRRISEDLKDAEEFCNLLKKAGPNEMATIAMVINQLSGGKLTKKVDISINITERNLTIKELIDEQVPGADYEKALVNVKTFFEEYNTEKNSPYV